MLAVQHHAVNALDRIRVGPIQHHSTRTTGMLASSLQESAAEMCSWASSTQPVSCFSLAPGEDDGSHWAEPLGLPPAASSR